VDGKKLKISEYKTLMRQKREEMRNLWYAGGATGAFPGASGSLPPGLTAADFSDSDDDIMSHGALESPKSTSGDEMSSPPPVVAGQMA